MSKKRLSPLILISNIMSKNLANFHENSLFQPLRKPFRTALGAGVKKALWTFYTSSALPRLSSPFRNDRGPKSGGLIFDRPKWAFWGIWCCFRCYFPLALDHSVISDGFQQNLLVILIILFLCNLHIFLLRTKKNLTHLRICVKIVPKKLCNRLLNFFEFAQKR